MDSSANKALMIGVAIFITIMITSAILFILGRMQEVYARVYETDISIQNQFGEFDSYDSTVKTGIEVMNAIRKYEDDPYVTIKFRTNLVMERGILLGTYTQESRIVEGIKQLLFNNSASTRNIGEGLAKSEIEVVDDFITITFTGL